MARVLLVEKDEELADIFSRHLHLDGHDLRIARTFTDAVTTAVTFLPQVLIIDLLLGDGPTGLAVAQRLCRSLSDLKIIIWGSPGAEGELNTGELNCAEIYAKNTPAKVLRTAVMRLASSHP